MIATRTKICDFYPETGTTTCSIGRVVEYSRAVSMFERWHGVERAPGTSIIRIAVGGYAVGNGPLCLLPGGPNLYVTVRVDSPEVSDPRPSLVYYEWTPSDPFPSVTAAVREAVAQVLREIAPAYDVRVALPILSTNRPSTRRSPPPNGYPEDGE